VRRIATNADAASEVVQFDERGFAPLHIASREGHAEVVRALVLLGAKVDTKNSLNGVTPLHSAAFRGHSEVCRAFTLFSI
jgi:ankyrin repeat protein